MQITKLKHWRLMLPQREYTPPRWVMWVGPYFFNWGEKLLPPLCGMDGKRIACQLARKQTVNREG